MIVEALRRLDKVARLDSYQYVGFGSIYFTDFSLFHRELGIGSMVSIEHDLANRPRFEFNQPFASVQLEFGESSEVLPTLDWRQRALVWLDYDSALDAGVPGDVATVVSEAAAGSVLLVTVNAEPERPIEGRVERLTNRVGASNVPLISRTPTWEGGRLPLAGPRRWVWYHLDVFSPPRGRVDGRPPGW
jgi:hypothetical protein